MYQVFCKGRKNSKWQPYSVKYETIKAAELCKQQAEERKTCNVHGDLIKYKINEVECG